MTPVSHRLPLLPGTLDLLILCVLKDGNKMAHEIAQAIADRSFGVLTAQTGSLHPALERLVRRGAIDIDWQSVSGTLTRRVYTLTQHGTTDLDVLKRRWAGATAAVERVIQRCGTAEEP